MYLQQWLWVLLGEPAMWKIYDIEIDQLLPDYILSWVNKHMLNILLHVISYTWNMMYISQTKEAKQQI